MTGNSRPLLALTLLVLPVLAAGCALPSASPDATVPMGRVGDVVEYQGSSAGTPYAVTLEVGGRTRIADAGGEEVDVFVVELEETMGPMTTPWTLWVRASDGRVAAGLNHCGYRDPQTRACADWVSLNHHLEGSPWALGASSFQGRPLKPHGDVVAHFPTQPNVTAVTYVAGEWEEREGRRLLPLSPSTDVGLLPGYPALGFANATFWMDPQVPYAAAIRYDYASATRTTRTELHLVAYRPGEGEAVPPSAPLPASVERPSLPGVAFASPTRGLPSDQPPAFSFALSDALRFAERNDSQLRAYLREHPDARLVGATWFPHGGGSEAASPLIHQESAVAWRLTYGSPSGAGFRVVVEESHGQTAVVAKDTQTRIRASEPAPVPPHAMATEPPATLSTLASGFRALDAFALYPTWVFVDEAATGRGGVRWDDTRFLIRLLYEPPGSGAAEDHRFLPALSLDATTGRLDSYAGPAAAVERLLHPASPR